MAAVHFSLPGMKLAFFVKIDGTVIVRNNGVDDTVIALQFP